jgi:hypothetical protein
MYSTSGNKILRENDEEVKIRGVSRPGLEYLYVDLPAMIPETIRSDLDKMKEWGFNCVRLPLRDKHWFENDHYREMIDFWVENILQRGMIALLDLHNQGDSPSLEPFIIKRTGGQKDAIQFWNEVSLKYGSIPEVWFEMYNEPHDISPDIWWNGNDQFHGYKDVLKTIRQNSENICVMGGLDWAYEWGFLPEQSFFSEIQKQTNLVLSTHPYGYRGKPQLPNKWVSEQIPTTILFPSYNDSFSGDCRQGITIPIVDKKDYGWNESFGYLHSLNQFPVIATEFGLDRPETAIQGGWFITDLLHYFGEIDMGFIAWAWVQDRLDYPSLLTHDFLPTGMALKDTQGPACSSKQNEFYPGPGHLIRNHLQQTSHRTLFSESIPQQKPIVHWSSSLFFLPLLGFIGRRFWKGNYQRLSTTHYINSKKEDIKKDLEICLEQKVFSDCQLRNRSSTSLI